MLSPSEAFQQQKPEVASETSQNADSTLFTPEQQQLFERRFQEGYDIRDPEYEAWSKITHPVDTSSEPRSDTSLLSTSTSHGKTCSQPSQTSSSSSDVFREIFVLPQPKQTNKKRKAALNTRAACITDADVLDELKAKEEKDEVRKRREVLRKNH